MKTATVTDFRNNMKTHLEKVEDDQDILILKGALNKDFVVLTLEQFNAMQETAHLLSTAANTKHLLESVAQHKSGNVVNKKIDLEPRKKEKVKPVNKRASNRVKK